MTGKRPAIEVVGVGETGPAREDRRSIPEMVLEVVEQALKDASLSFDDVDAVVSASVDLFDGMTASNIAITEVAGAVMKPETRIAADGLGALIHAGCQLWAEGYETALVVAHGKASMSDHQSLTAWAMDPVYMQPLGIDFLACAGLQARAIAAHDDQAEPRWANIVGTRRAGANGRGLATACTADEVLASPIAAAPLRKEMCAPMGDGACAIIVRTVKKKTDRQRVLLTGVGHDLSPHSLGERDLCKWEGLERACTRAYAMSGITDPAAAFDLAEPSCLYPHEEELFLEASRLDAGIKISPDGGLFAGAVPVAAGLSRAIAAVKQMRDHADCRRALVHGAWGPGGQGQAVAILEATAS